MTEATKNEGGGRAERTDRAGAATGAVGTDGGGRVQTQWATSGMEVV
jgi:hypothetical protein